MLEGTSVNLHISLGVYENIRGKGYL